MTLENSIECSTHMEQVVKGIRERTYREIREGYYVICMKGEDGFEFGTRWLVCPDEKTENITSGIRNTKTYRLLYAKDPVAPEFRHHDLFFGEERVVDGKFLSEHFVKGELNTVRIISSHVRLCRYYMYDFCTGEELAKGNNLSELLLYAAERGYKLRLIDEDGVEHFTKIR